MFLDQGRLGGGLDFNFLRLYQLTHTKWRERGRDYFLRDPVLKYTWGVKSQVMSHKKTRISITQWLLLHVTWPLSLSLVSTWITIRLSAHIFSRGCHGSFTSLRWISHFYVEKDRSVMTQTRLCRSSPLMIWVTWIFENVSICEENPVGWI